MEPTEPLRVYGPPRPARTYGPPAPTRDRTGANHNYGPRPDPARTAANDLLNKRITAANNLDFLRAIPGVAGGTRAIGGARGAVNLAKGTIFSNADDLARAGIKVIPGTADDIARASAPGAFSRFAAANPKKTIAAAGVGAVVALDYAVGGLLNIFRPATPHDTPATQSAGAPTVDTTPNGAADPSNTPGARDDFAEDLAEAFSENDLPAEPLDGPLDLLFAPLLGAGNAIADLGLGAGAGLAGVGLGAGDGLAGLGEGFGAAAANVGSGAGDALAGIGQGFGSGLAETGNATGDAIRKTAVIGVLGGLLLLVLKDKGIRKSAQGLDKPAPTSTPKPRTVPRRKDDTGSPRIKRLGEHAKGASA